MIAPAPAAAMARPVTFACRVETTTGTAAPERLDERITVADLRANGAPVRVDYAQEGRRWSGAGTLTVADDARVIFFTVGPQVLDRIGGRRYRLSGHYQLPDGAGIVATDGRCRRTDPKP